MGVPDIRCQDFPDSASFLGCVTRAETGVAASTETTPLRLPIGRRRDRTGGTGWLLRCALR